MPEDIYRLLPTFVTLVVALLGFYAWHRQLAAKRRFELAEEIIKVAVKAKDAISRIRRAFVSNEELFAVQVAQDSATSANLQELKRIAAILTRVDRERDLFAELRTTQIIAKVHLPEELQSAITVLLDVRRDILSAAHSYSWDLQLYQQEIDEAKRQALAQQIRKANDDLRELRVGVQQVASENDRISARVDAAIETINEHCAPYLRDPTFWEFLSNRRKP